MALVLLESWVGVVFGFLSLIGGFERLGLRLFLEGGLSLTTNECDYASTLYSWESGHVFGGTASIN